MGAEGLEGAEEDEGDAIYLILDGQDTTGIGYKALWGFGAKCWSGWSGVDGVDGYPLDRYDYQSTCGPGGKHSYCSDFRWDIFIQNPKSKYCA